MESQTFDWGKVDSFLVGCNFKNSENKKFNEQEYYEFLKILIA